MKTSIVTIGNSQGVRIPKILLEQSRLSGEVELVVKGESIVITAARRPRADWTEKIRAVLADSGGHADEVLGENIANRFDEEEWEW